MKKVNLSEKIQLDKEIISKLGEDQLKELEGGAQREISCITGNNSCVAQEPEQSA
ncbi:class I lanthipeptide [Pedobacter sp. NJ-S-72]